MPPAPARVADGVNYFPAVDAELCSKFDAQYNSLSLGTLLQQLEESKAGVKLLFLDACRDNPFVRRMQVTDRTIRRGLVNVGQMAEGTMIHYATEAGGLADDGARGNGLFTSVLLRYLDEPGLEVETMMKRVTDGVERAARAEKRRQVPWREGNLRGEFYFRPATKGLSAEQIEQQAWEETLKGNTVTLYDAYLAAYPQGRFAGLAQIKRAKLLPVATAPTVPAPFHVATANGLIKDCDICPEMVLIPGGSFMMGDERAIFSGELPVHRVTLPDFLLGKIEVTQVQWQAVMGNNPTVRMDCMGNCPVQNVSWADAQAFVKKLSKHSGKVYRLPSEAEWEYAARAGSATTYPWGQQASHEHANYGEEQCCAGVASGRDRWIETAPVARFAANRFGLHDMHGNVWELVQDCWHEDYKEAPNDGSAWTANCFNDNYFVVRGGSASSSRWFIRSATRRHIERFYRYDEVGLRVARSVQ